MKAKRSRLLVVDACVARSAGETEHPMSSCCRNALLSILSICHHIIITRAIQDEWNRHASRFTRKWLRSMTARRKVERHATVLSCHASRSLEQLSSGEQQALQKDLCLVEAACEGDGIILTRDDEIVTIWEKCKDQFDLPKTIRWINPGTSDAHFLECL
jgi:hypothetical protein